MVEREIADGLIYSKFKWKETRVHTLSMDITKRKLRAVPAGPTYPLWPYYKNRPPMLARSAGAIASVGAGFPLTSNHKFGVVSQPAHLLVIDKEIWTTGIGHGGYAVLLSDDRAWIESSDTQVYLWSEGRRIPVDHVNRGHYDTCAFTYRGGTNETPIATRYQTTLKNPGKWTWKHGRGMREWVVAEPVFNVPVAEGTMNIETDAPLNLTPGTKVTWVQDLNDCPRVTDAVSGMTELIRGGENVVSDIFGGASGGPDAWYIRKNPRTAIGVSHGGQTVTVIAAEGRVKGSKGFRLKEFANLLIELDCYSAVNLDGGGSTHMWIRGMGLVADSCYGDGTLYGTRPNIYATAIF